MWICVDARRLRVSKSQPVEEDKNIKTENLHRE
jgi:hypothetical protein